MVEFAPNNARFCQHGRPGFKFPHTPLGAGLFFLRVQMSERRELPQRRRSETFELTFGGIEKKFAVTVGYYADNSIGEVFIVGGKSGEQVEAIARDGAVLLSLALQYGAQLPNIAHAITRDGQGQPSSVVGAVIDQLQRERMQ
jgi:hypothetical protein